MSYLHTQIPLSEPFFTDFLVCSEAAFFFKKKIINYKIKYWEKLNCLALTDLCHQRSSVQGAKFIRNVVVPVGTRVQMA